MRVASKSKTKGRFCCLIRILFAPEEVKGKSVCGSKARPALDQQRVDQIRRCGVFVYGELAVSEKVWRECTTSMNAHLRKYPGEQPVCTITSSSHQNPSHILACY